MKIICLSKKIVFKFLYSDHTNKTSSLKTFFIEVLIFIYAIIDLKDGFSQCNSIQYLV